MLWRFAECEINQKISYWISPSIENNTTSTCTNIPQGHVVQVLYDKKIACGRRDGLMRVLSFVSTLSTGRTCAAAAAGSVHFPRRLATKFLKRNSLHRWRRWPWPRSRWTRMYRGMRIIRQHSPVHCGLHGLQHRGWLVNGREDTDIHHAGSRALHSRVSRPWRNFGWNRSKTGSLL